MLSIHPSSSCHYQRCELSDSLRCCEQLAIGLAAQFNPRAMRLYRISRSHLVAIKTIKKIE